MLNAKHTKKIERNNPSKGFSKFFLDNSHLFKQVFVNSCAANCCAALFTYLAHKNGLNLTKNKIAKLQIYIYSKIWHKKGDIADKNKATPFLEEYSTKDPKISSEYFYFIQIGNHVSLAVEESSQVHLFDIDYATHEKFNSLSQLTKEKEPVLVISINSNHLNTNKIESTIKNLEKNFRDTLIKDYLTSSNVSLPPLEILTNTPSLETKILINHLTLKDKFLIHFTEEDMEDLKKFYKNPFHCMQKSFKEINTRKSILNKLNYTQKKGISLGLPLEKVQHKNFKRSILKIKKSGNLSEGIKDQKIDAILEFRLTFKQVMHPNFGNHTISAMRKKVPYQEAIKLLSVKNLSYQQIKKNTLFYKDYNIHQKMSFRKSIFSLEPGKKEILF